MLKGDCRASLKMGLWVLRGCSASALVLAHTVVSAEPPPRSGPAEDGSPAWYMYERPARPGRDGPPRIDTVEECAADAAKLGIEGRNALMANWQAVSLVCQDALSEHEPNPFSKDRSDFPTCVRSVICEQFNGQGINWRTNPSGLHNGVGGHDRVLWRSDPEHMGYTISYPYDLPEGGDGAVGVGIDSQDNLWVLQRANEGIPALTKFNADREVIFQIGDDVLGHLNKAHGMAVDSEDNAWIADPSSAIIMKISPDGELLQTIGERGRRGDWDEEKGQRLLWQPISITFGPDGDIFIGQGHANESPNDYQSGEPHNLSGAARVTRLDKDGNFVSQLYGNMTGAGKFSQVHDLAIDPRNGDLWIADREQYRLVVYSNEGEFIKTVQTRNLMCNVAFDKNGDLWVGTGGDGQFLRMDRDGKVLGAMGNGPGGGFGETGETAYLRWDSKGNLITGSTTQPRVTVFTPPQGQL